MYLVFLILTILFGAALVAGFVWFLVSSGRTTHRSGPEVGAEIMGAVTDQEEEEGGQVSIPLAEKTWFRGTGASVHSESGMSYAEIRHQLDAGNLRQVLPALLLIAGVVGTTFFLGLTLLAAGADAIFGLFFVGFGLYVAYLVGSGILRAK
jgi:hypothetical protein